MINVQVYVAGFYFLRRSYVFLFFARGAILGRLGAAGVAAQVVKKCKTRSHILSCNESGMCATET